MKNEQQIDNIVVVIKNAAGFLFKNKVSTYKHFSISKKLKGLKIYKQIISYQ